MKAIGLWGGKFAHLERREYLLDEVGPMQALVEVRASGVCGTDLNFLRDTEGELRPLGHEISGVVLYVGELVQNVRVGDSVVVEDVAACGTCRDCQEGSPNLCRNLINTEGRPGLATHMLVDARLLVPFTGLDFEAASLTEPLAVGLTAAVESDIPLGGSVVVFGAGPIGLFAARCALLRGAGFVAVVGSSRQTPLGAKRLETAGRLGSHLVLAGREVNVAAEVHKHLPNGADRVIVTSPPQTLSQALACVRFGGCVAVLGLDFGGKETIPLDVNQIVFNKIDIKGVIAEPAMRFRAALELLKSKKVDATLFQTHFCTFENIGETLRGVLERRIAAVKVCLKPQQPFVS